MSEQYLLALSVKTMNMNKTKEKWNNYTRTTEEWKADDLHLTQQELNQC